MPSIPPHVLDMGFTTTTITHHIDPKDFTDGGNHKIKLENLNSYNGVQMPDAANMTGMTISTNSNVGVSVHQGNGEPVKTDNVTHFNGPQGQMNLYHHVGMSGGITSTALKLLPTADQRKAKTETKADGTQFLKRLDVTPHTVGATGAGVSRIKGTDSYFVTKHDTVTKEQSPMHMMITKAASDPTYHKELFRIKETEAGGSVGYKISDSAYKKLSDDLNEFRQVHNPYDNKLIMDVNTTDGKRPKEPVMVQLQLHRTPLHKEKGFIHREDLDHTQEFTKAHLAALVGGAPVSAAGAEPLHVELEPLQAVKPDAARG